jgi:toxin ParE1/3/4
VTRRVIWSRRALDEIVEIGRYIARDNPPAARRVATALRDAGNRLGEAPIGRPGRVTGTYEKVIPRLPYIIAYTLSPYRGAEAVVILRVIHGARNWPDGQWPE